MNEIKKYLGSFALCVTFLFSLAGILVGSITAEKRAQKVLYGTQYAVLSFGNEGVARKNENTVTVDISKLEKFLREFLKRSPMQYFRFFLPNVRKTAYVERNAENIIG